MASLSLPSLNALTSPGLPNQKPPYLNSSISRMSSFRYPPTFTTHRFQCGAIRMQAGEEYYELKQMRDMAAAKKRWDAMIREGKIKVLTPREAGYAVQLSNKPLLDVRPASEREKAWVKGSTWIPIFDVDNRFDVGTLSRKVTNFVMGGWWSGVPTLSYDRRFLSKVEEKFPKDAELIVACQKGLRSLAACELLCKAGYRNLFWVQGGLEAAEEEFFSLGSCQGRYSAFEVCGNRRAFRISWLDRSTESSSCQRRLGLPVTLLCSAGWTFCGC
ncbi:hypothetical protein DITRI_Ditri04bG0031000 [Diplodiscus trichospermus]